MLYMDKGKLKKLRHLFWEYDFKELDPFEDEHLIMRKVLSYGGIDDLKTLMDIFGKKRIKEFLLKTKGRGINKKRLRFYEVFFDLPKKEVDSWLKDPLRKLWNR